jgi:hypothetical protein
MTTQEAKELVPGDTVYEVMRDSTLVWEVVKIMVAPPGQGYRGFNVTLRGGEEGTYYIGTYNAHKFSRTPFPTKGTPVAKHRPERIATAE